MSVKNALPLIHVAINVAEIVRVEKFLSPIAYCLIVFTPLLENMPITSVTIKNTVKIKASMPKFINHELLNNYITHI